MSFRKIGIIGMGLMGGSIAKKIEQDHLGEVLLPEQSDLFAEADVIVLAIPISAILEKAAEIGKVVLERTKPLVIIDLGSVKKQIHELFEFLSNEKIEYVPTHPMAGKENSGWDHSDPELFDQATWVITPHGKNRESTLKSLEEWIRSLGANPLRMSPDDHDIQAAMVSHIPSLLARFLLKYAQEEEPDSLEMAGPGFRSMTRLAHDNPELHQEIEKFNQENIHHLLKGLVHSLSSAIGPEEKAPKPSATGVIAAKIGELKRSGEKVFDFAAGEVELPDHPIIRETVLAVMEENVSSYSPVAGLPELRGEAATWMNKRYQSQFQRNNTIVTCGGKFAISAAFKAVLSRGDEVLIPAPFWPSFPEMVRLAGGTPSIIKTREEEDWKLTPKNLKEGISSKSKMLILNHPNNPSGEVYSREELKALLDVAKEHNLMVLSDEVYSELVFDQPFISCASFEEHKDHVIVIESCSKNFAMAGWRVGFAFGAEKIISKVIAIQSQMTTGTSTLSQKVALAVLKEHVEVSRYVREQLQKKRDLFVNQYNALFKEKIESPHAGPYVFVKMKNASQTCKELIEKAHVGLVPGDAFGEQDYVRICFAREEETIIGGLRAIVKMGY